MATFFDQAAQQVAPIYDQQIQQAQAQIPQIQQLYTALIQGLEQSNTQQLNTGVQNIAEDASARGVLRSTMPVDARTTLTAQLGAALNQGKSQLGLQQLQDIGNINTQIGGLQQGRLNAINSLADQLYQRDLAERDFQLKQQMAAAEARASASSRTASAAAKPLKFQEAASYAYQYLTSKAGKDTYVSPAVYKRVKNDFLGAGFTDKQWQSFALKFKNPHTKY